VTEAYRPLRAAQEHLSDEDAAECAERPQRAAVDVLGHLETCAECGNRVASIVELSALLEDLPDIEMPFEVSRRIEAAIGREQLRDSMPAQTERPARSRRRMLTALGWLTGVAALSGALIGLVVLPGSSGGSSSSATAASGAQPFSAQSRALAGAAPGSESENGPAGGITAGSSAGGYQNLTEWVQALVPATGLTPYAKRLPTGDVLACLAGSPLAGSRLIATETGDYRGSAAALAVYADGNDPSTVIGVIFAVPCTAAKHTVLQTGAVPVS
jgi:hypothetical protein